MIKKHKEKLILKMGTAPNRQPHALLAFLSLSGFYPLTSLRGSHHGGEVIEESPDQDPGSSHLSLPKIINELNNKQCDLHEVNAPPSGHFDSWPVTIHGFGLRITASVDPLPFSVGGGESH